MTTEMKIAIIILLLFAAFGFAQDKFNEQKVYESFSETKTDAKKEPLQSIYKGNKNIIKQEKDKKYTLTIEAQYKISGRIVSKSDYMFSWESGISPYDIALVWGELADPKVDDYMDFSQGGRRLYFNFRRDIPYSPDYINSHVSNNHIIPVNEEIDKKLRSTKVNQIVNLEGYLVNVKLEDNSGLYTWNTSTSRTDSFDGACEILYVTKVY